MAKIVKTTSQEMALKEIQEGLKIVTSLNVLLEDEPLNDCKIKIMGTSGGRTKGEQFGIPYQQISIVLKDYRKKLVSEIQQKSKTFSIILDDADMEILNPKKENAGNQPSGYEE